MGDHFRLEAALVEFAQMLTRDVFAVADVLEGLCARAVEILPIVGAGVSIPEGDAMRVLCAHGQHAQELEDLQARLGEGPCEVVMATGNMVAAHVDEQVPIWPKYIPAAAKLGVRSIMALPLQTHGQTWGVLDVYSNEANAFGPDDSQVLRVLADVAMAYVLIARQRQEHQTAVDQLRQHSLHDALTGLPNRVLLADRLRHALAGIGRAPGSVGVLFCDLDRFKAVNDTFGHLTGDRLLVEVTRRLERCLRYSDTLGRFGGDELLVVCENLHMGGHELETIGRRLLATLNEPFVLPEGEFLVRISMGAVLATTDDTFDTLLRDADMAMYAAKRHGGGTLVTSDRRTDPHMAEAVRTEPELQHALELGELRLFFQPVVALQEGGPEGYEALMRWQHPRRGLLTAGTFLPVAEENPLIVSLGRWALTEGCRRIRDLCPADASPAWSLAVNVSARQLRDPDFTTQVADILAETAADPTRLVLEVTETTLVRRSGRGIAALRTLTELGIRVAIDDFGTGYSSLAYLTHLPATILKIDRTFIHHLGQGPRHDALVRGTVALAHELELSVTAEGVETVAQHDLLVAAGCDSGQGYLYGRPAQTAGKPPTTA